MNSCSESGKCDLASNVICPGLPTPPANGCAPKSGAASGDVNNANTCGSYQYCNNGVLDPFVEDCSPLHFNPDSEVCDVPENLATPCTDPVAMMTMRSMRTETSPATVDIPKAPIMKSSIFRDKIAGFLISKY